MPSPVITSTANDRVQRVRALHQRSNRLADQAYLIEGVRLVEEALAAGVGPTLVLVEPEQLRATKRGGRLLERLQEHRPLVVTARVLAAAAEAVTPQGVVAVLPLPPVPREVEPGPLLLVVDGVRDPGNLGTILRSAAASGVVQTVVAIDCVDLYAPKVLRAGMGAHFHLTLLGEVASELDAREAWDWVRELAPGRPIWLAEATGGVPYDQVDWRRDAVLAVGGEAFGAGEWTARASTGRVSIPLAGPAESLNVAMATSILLFEAARQRQAARPAA